MNLFDLIFALQTFLVSDSNPFYLVGVPLPVD